LIGHRGGRACGAASGGAAASAGCSGCGTASGRDGGRGVGRGRATDALEFVLDGLVEGAGHAGKREDGGEGEVRVGAVLERDRGEADEVDSTILAYGGVYGPLDAGSCGDVDRFRERCRSGK